MKTWDELELIKNESLPLWKNRDFIIIYLALLISGTGDGIAKIALLSFVYDLTSSSTAVGMVFTCLTFPSIFSGLMAGVLADRYSKLKILIVGHLLLGVTTAGFVLACHHKSTVLIYFLAFMTGILMAFADGPFRAYFPDIFPYTFPPLRNLHLQDGHNKHVCTLYYLFGLAMLLQRT